MLHMISVWIGRIKKITFDAPTSEAQRQRQSRNRILSGNASKKVSVYQKSEPFPPLAEQLHREYGIPAIVGVDQTTTRLHTGQRIRINGSSGEILMLEEEPES